MKSIIAGIMLAGISVTTVSAQEAEWDFDAYVGASSDYRDRGLRLSDGDFSAFGSVAAFHETGFYVGLDAASIKDGFGNDARTEFYAGYTIDAGDYIYDFSVEAEGIHGDSSEFYPELKASIARDFGIAYIRGGVAYAFEGRWNTPGVDSFYNYLDLELPVPLAPSLTLLTHVGYDIRDGRSNLWDWSVGLSAFVMDNLELSVSYESNSLDQAIGKNGFMFGAKIYF